MQDNKAKALEGSLERHICDRLKERRLACGLSHEEVDRRTGAIVGTTKRFESGERLISSSQLYGLSLALGVELSYFFPDSVKSREYPSLAPPPEAIHAALQLLKVYYSIEEQDLRRSVMDLLKEISQEEILPEWGDGS